MPMTLASTLRRKESTLRPPIFIADCRGSLGRLRGGACGEGDGEARANILTDGPRTANTGILLGRYRGEGDIGGQDVIARLGAAQPLGNDLAGVDARQRVGGTERQVGTRRRLVFLIEQSLIRFG